MLPYYSFLYKLYFSKTSVLFNVTYGRFLKANLSWTRKKSNSRWFKKNFNCVFNCLSFFFALNAQLYVLKFKFCHITLG